MLLYQFHISVTLENAALDMHSDASIWYKQKCSKLLSWSEVDTSSHRICYMTYATNKQNYSRFFEKTKIRTYQTLEIIHILTGFLQYNIATFICCLLCKHGSIYLPFR